MIGLIIKQIMNRKYYTVYYGATESEVWNKIKNDGLQQVYQMEWEKHFSSYTEGMALINTINNSISAGKNDVLKQLHCNLGDMRYDCDFIAYTTEDEVVLSTILNKVIPSSTLPSVKQKENLTKYRALIDAVPEEREDMRFYGGVCVANVLAKET